MAGGGNPGNVDPVKTQPQQYPRAPGQVQGPTPVQGGMPQAAQGNVYQQAAGNTNMAAGMTAGSAQYNPTAFMNPYTSSVIDRTMGDMNRARQMTMNDIGAQATSAGAFGGSRHGLLEAETNRNFFDQAGDFASRMRANAFDNAQNANFQLNNQLRSAAGQLSGIGQQQFNMGQAIGGRQAQQGAQQQALQQQIIDAARAQYGGFTGAPNSSIATRMGAASGVPYSQSQTTTKMPGLFDFMSLGLSLV